MFYKHNVSHLDYIVSLLHFFCKIKPCSMNSIRLKPPFTPFEASKRPV